MYEGCYEIGDFTLLICGEYSTDVQCTFRAVVALNSLINVLPSDVLVTSPSCCITIMEWGKNVNLDCRPIIAPGNKTYIVAKTSTTSRQEINFRKMNVLPSFQGRFPMKRHPSSGA